ncbi:MAG: hypothetical protein CHACPFDD_01729 [Phycisphaerae bacterium]|nr:hypothetical protein [Phycisphaerae bacterium]
MSAVNHRHARLCSVNPQSAAGHALLLALALVGSAAAQVPPGYKVVHVTESPEYDSSPRINNRGQIVFLRRYDINDRYTQEIMLYDNGQLIRLTDDYVWDAEPDINDDGVVVWLSRIGANSTAEIIRYENGQLTQITNNDTDDYSPRINGPGHVVWSAMNRFGCENSGSELRLFDGTAIVDITANGFSNQRERLNDLGEILWTRFDFCPKPWESVALFYSNGQTTQLTVGQRQPRTSSLNNKSQAAWTHGVDTHSEIQIWQAGVTTTLTNWGTNVYLNNTGQIAFDRWHDDTEVWQVWYVVNGEFLRLTDEPVWNVCGDINDRGEVAWERGMYPGDVDIRYMKRLPAGDLNCDDRVDFSDVDPLVLLLTDPGAYAAQFPNCDRRLADVNGDGSVNAFDVDPFIELLP